MRPPELPEDPLRTAQGCLNALTLAFLLGMVGYILWRIFT